MAFDFNQNQQESQNNYNGGGSYKKKFNLSPKLIIILILVIAVACILSTSFFVVDQTEQAVILRFGKYNRTVGPGLQTKLPFGIDKSYNVETQVVQTMSFGFRSATAGNTYGTGTSYTYNGYASESTMLTGDLNIVDVKWIVQYKIDDPNKWLFSVNNPEQTLSDVSRSVINQLVGDLPILSIMTSERTTIEVEAEQLMQDTLDSYNMGVKIVTVKLQDIVPPEGDVQDAFEDVNKAIQDMNKYINEGKENYNSTIPSAQGEASKIIQEAQGYASERINTAKGDVARFESVKAEYEKSKEVTSKRLYIETMEEILSDAEGTVTLIDERLENFLPIANITGGIK